MFQDGCWGVCVSRFVCRGRENTEARKQKHGAVRARFTSAVPVNAAAFNQCSTVAGSRPAIDAARSRTNKASFGIPFAHGHDRCSKCLVDGPIFRFWSHGSCSGLAGPCELHKRLCQAWRPALCLGMPNARSSDCLRRGWEVDALAVDKNHGLSGQVRQVWKRINVCSFVSS